MTAYEEEAGRLVRVESWNGDTYFVAGIGIAPGHLYTTREAAEDVAVVVRGQLATALATGARREREACLRILAEQPTHFRVCETSGGERYVADDVQATLKEAMTRIQERP